MAKTVGHEKDSLTTLQIAFLLLRATFFLLPCKQDCLFTVLMNESVWLHFTFHRNILFIRMRVEKYFISDLTVCQIHCVFKYCIVEKAVLGGRRHGVLCYFIFTCSSYPLITQ